PGRGAMAGKARRSDSRPAATGIRCWASPTDQRPHRAAGRRPLHVPSNSERGAGGLLLMRGVQHFDQTVFQLETLMQQLSEPLQFAMESGDIAATAAVAAVIESQCDFGDGLDPRVDLLGQFQTTLVAKDL